MPRKPEITRTMQVTRAMVLCIDLESKTTFEVPILLTSRYKTEKQLVDAATKELSNYKTKVVCVLHNEKQMIRFKMSEQKFINTAEKAEIIKIEGE